jgi:hypothetical protein
MIDTANIREHMEVIASDGGHVGRVDHVMGDKIELAKFDFGSGLTHHLIPVSWIDHVDQHVHLNRSKDETKAEWQERH